MTLVLKQLQNTNQLNISSLVFPRNYPLLLFKTRMLSMEK